MHRTIQHSLIFLTLFIFASVAIGDAFDQTVDQIKILEVELEQNQIDIDEKQTSIEEELGTFRANHALNAPKGEFESDADYAARLSRLAAAVTQRRAELEERNLSSLRADRLETQTEISRLYRTVFLTNDVVGTLGRYDANDEYFPITFVANNESVNVRLYIDRQNGAPNLKNNWDKVVKTAYISIDPGYRRALAQVKLEYPPLWGQGVSWIVNNVVYNLGNNNSIAFSPDGKYIATASNDEHGIADIWEMENGEKFRKMDHGDWVYAVAFSPNGEYLATAGQDETRYSYNGKAIIWDMDKGTKYQTVAHNAHVRSIAFSPDSKFFATNYLVYSYLGRILFFRVGGGWIWWRDYNANRSTIQALTFSSDGKYLATGWVRTYSYLLDGVTLRRVSDGTAAYHFEHKNGVYAVAFSPNGKYLATGNRESVTLWEISSGRSVRQIELPDTTSYAVTFSPDGEFLAVGKSNGYINLFRVGTEEITLETDIPRVRSIYTGSEVTDLAWHPYGSFISDGKKVYRTLLPSEEVSLTPPSLLSSEINPVEVGTTFTLDFSVKNISDLAGWQLEVAFNPDVLSVVEAKEADFLKSGGGGTFFQRGNTDNTAGKITNLSAALLGGGSVSGEGTLFSITFEAKAAGDGELQLQSTQFSNLDGQIIPHEVDVYQVLVEERPLVEDVNRDKVVNIQDLVLVASRFGQAGQSNADVNGDRIVNIQDLVLVATAFGTTAAAPSLYAQSSKMPTTVDVKQWLTQAQQLNLTDATSQRGIFYLEQLLTALTPKETSLLSNYPNPFNPETWIPYQLAESADVKISIYAADGKLVRTLNLGHQLVGIYQGKNRAAYWDGKNKAGEPVASGVYFYTLTAGEFTATRKMVIRK